MAKRSRRKSARAEKDNAGCMWGFISLFDFRQGQSPRKLISDRKRGSGRHGVTGFSRNKFEPLGDLEEEDGDITEIDQSETGTTDPSVTSVKSLMEEEMSKLQPSKKNTQNEVEPISSKLGPNMEKSHKKGGKVSKMTTDLLLNDLELLANLDSQSHCSNPLERSTSNFDLAAFMIDFYGDNHQNPERHVDCSTTTTTSCPSETNRHLEHNNLAEYDSVLAEKLSVIRKALADVAETVLTRNFVEAKQVFEKAPVYESKQFVDALETLNANKELFLNLIQDQNSILYKQMQDLRNAQVGELSESADHSDMRGEDVISSRQPEEFSSINLFDKQHGHSFLRKKEKAKTTKPTKESDGGQCFNRIVVLKPTPSRTEHSSISVTPSSTPSSCRSLEHQEVSERVKSYFSFKEIKRKLKHVIGDSKKDQDLISMDAVLHKVPYGYKGTDAAGKKKIIEKAVPSRSSIDAKHTSSQPSVLAMKRDKRKSESRSAYMKIGDCTRMEVTTATSLLHRESSLYEEAKKHLVERLNSADEKETLQFRKTSKSLGRVLSLTDDSMLSPRFSPAREKVTELSPRHIIYSSRNLIKQENAVNDLCAVNQTESSSLVDTCTDAAGQDNDPRLQLHEPHMQDGVCIKQDSKPEGSKEIAEMANMEFVEENKNVLEPPESCEAQQNDLCDACEDRGSTSADQSSDEAITPEASPSIPCAPSSLLIHHTVAPEIMMEKPDRSSPVSVLEPFCLEVFASPQSSSAEQNDLPVEPRELHFEEHEGSASVLTSRDHGVKLITSLDDKQVRDEFIRTMIEASGLSCDEVCERRHLSCQLLEQSLLNELGTSHDQLTDYSQLLFDCINEVLGEIYIKYFGCSPWMSSIMPKVRPIPRGTSLIQEVSRGVDWHVRVQLPTTLDQLVSKDLEGRSWMVLWVENEDVIDDMVDDILEYLMEETILELWV